MSEVITAGEPFADDRPLVPTTHPVQAPSREDPLVGRWSAVVGGRAGARLAGATGLWRAASVLVLLASVMLSLALVGKQHCRAEGWSTPDQFWHACYSDLPAVYSSANLGGPAPVGLPSALTSLGQPPLAGTAMWLVAQLVPAGQGPEEAARSYFDLWVVLASVALLLAVAVLAVTVAWRGWDAAHLALSPVLLTSAFINVELLAVLFVAGALFGWSRRRHMLAGVLLGAAMATRPSYAVVAFALFLLAARSGRWRGAGITIGAGVATWLGIRVLLLPGWTGGVGAAWDAWRAQGAGFGSVWFVPDLLARSRPRAVSWWIPGGMSTTTVTAFALGALLAVLIGAFLLALGTTRRPRLAHLALFLLAGVLLVGKAVPPQASLLLLPLMAAAGLRWRDHLLWAGAESVYFVSVWLYIAADSDPNRGMTPALYAIVLVVRLAVLGWIMVCAARAATRPELDLVRSAEPGVDDPSGGDLDGAPDALVVRLG